MRAHTHTTANTMPSAGIKYLSRAAVALATASALMALASCSNAETEIGGPEAGTGQGVIEEPQTQPQESSGGLVRLVTHSSFDMDPQVIANFEEQTGYELQVIPMDDAGTLASQLVLTAGNPLGDVVFGIDNTFASRVMDAGVLQSHNPSNLPASAQAYVLGSGLLTPVSMGDVCLNIDLDWFADNPEITAPQSIADLTNPELYGLTVVLNPATSSPGLAFMLATIDIFGQDGWLDFWADLTTNGAQVASSWSSAYFGDFTTGGGGPFPIVVSYASSPAFTLNDDGTASTTAAVLDGCFRQVEFAGVLSGADNPSGAAALVDFMVGHDFQQAIPTHMWVFPIDTSVELPSDWAQFAPLPAQPIFGDPDAIASNREHWVEQWMDTVIG